MTHPRAASARRRLCPQRRQGPTSVVFARAAHREDPAGDPSAQAVLQAVDPRELEGVRTRRLAPSAGTAAIDRGRSIAITLDRRGRVTSLAPALAAALGQREHRVLGRSADDVLGVALPDATYESIGSRTLIDARGDQAAICIVWRTVHDEHGYAAACGVWDPGGGDEAGQSRGSAVTSPSG